MLATIVAIVLGYLFVGWSVVQRDFGARVIDQPAYARNQDARLALLVVLLWLFRPLLLPSPGISRVRHVVSQLITGFIEWAFMAAWILGIWALTGVVVSTAWLRLPLAALGLFLSSIVMPFFTLFLGILVAIVLWPVNAVLRLVFPDPQPRRGTAQESASAGASPDPGPRESDQA